MLGPIFQCYLCDTVFTTPNISYFMGQATEVCPNKQCLAEALDWDFFSGDDFYDTFYGIVGANFDEARRTNLREMTEISMGPYNPLIRLL